MGGTRGRRPVRSGERLTSTGGLSPPPPPPGPAADKLGQHPAQQRRLAAAAPSDEAENFHAITPDPAFDGGTVLAEGRRKSTNSTPLRGRRRLLRVAPGGRAPVCLPGGA